MNIIIQTSGTSSMDEVDDQLMNEISPSLPESRRTVALLIDEM